ncbi:MAG TPA: hypothetical protein VN577_16195 [Terriglobales bacterium]|nr:hypothetical protein [Terriglobales bacterium]
MHVAAAVVSVLYIAVQSFQWWVFAKVPEGNGLAGALESGAHPLNVARSWLMLLAIFGLVFVYYTVCLTFERQNRAGAWLAFLGFFVFFLMEITLRSTELFYFQIQLPAEFHATTDAAVRASMLHSMEVFQGIQHALYFPLMMAPTLGSVIVLTVIPRVSVHWPIAAAMAINALRVALRIVGEYLGWNVLSPAVMTWSYLPLVFMVWGLTAWWLVRMARGADAGSRAAAA